MELESLPTLYPKKKKKKEEKQKKTKPSLEEEENLCTNPSPGAFAV